jgi:hypothetical protein
MECGKIDIAMLVLMAVLVVAVGVLYLFIIPAMFVLFGIAAQCAAEDPQGRYVAFVAAFAAAAFAGYKAVDLLDPCGRRGGEQS